MPHVELPQAEFKVVLLGDTNTGKTSLVLRFVEGYYRDGGRSPTIGAFFLTRRVTVHQMTTCKLLLWDTAGQSQYAKLAKTYYQQAAAAILTYDVSQPQSLHRLRLWLEELHQNTAGRKLVVAIVACKNDLDASLHAPGLKEEAERLARSVGALHVVTSAKTSEGVPELFEQLAEKVWECHQDSSMNGGLPIPVHEGGSNIGRKRHVRSKSPPSRASTPPPRTPQVHQNPATTTPKLELKAIDSDSANDSGDDLVVKEPTRTAEEEHLICDGSFLSCTDDPDRNCVIL